MVVVNNYYKKFLRRAEVTKGIWARITADAPDGCSVMLIGQMVVGTRHF